MNRTVILIFVILSVSFDSFPSSHAKEQRGALVLKGRSVEPLDRQARQYALAFWNARIVKCGEYYYTKDRNYVHQFRNISISVTSRAVTAANRLNGLRWLGYTSVTVEQSRTYSPNQTIYQNSRWSAWSDGFTMAMGGIGLNAEVRNDHGSWRVIPSAISQAGVLQSLTCADASDPAAFFARLASQRYGAAVATFREKASSMGIYAHNIPDDMWDALYRCGYSGSTANYSTVGWVYLAANGGWGVCGRNGCRTKDFPSWAQGLSIEQVTKDGGYVAINKSDDKNKAKFDVSGIPVVLHHWLYAYTLQGQDIDKVRIGYHGEWFVLASGLRKCFGCGPRDYWTWGGVPKEASEAFQQITVRYEASRFVLKESVKDVAFLPNGGYVILTGRNTYYAGHVPDEAKGILEMLRSSNSDISQVSFGPNGSWVIRANGVW